MTFIGRGLEPYRGFHSFMRALPEILAKRPAAHVVLVGGEEPHYGGKPKQGGTWKQVLLAELEGRLDLSRVHFTGKVPHAALAGAAQHFGGACLPHLPLRAVLVDA